MTDTRSAYHAAIRTTSLVVGPALMSTGDLFHPPEAADAAVQIAIIAGAASRWYAAHLLLFLGLLVFVPGLLALTQLTAQRSPAVGLAARLLMLVSVGAMSAVFVFEMLVGRFIAGGADLATAVALLETFQSPEVFLALVPGLLAFFVGTALFVAPLASEASPFRWPAIAFGLGALLILGEIVLAQVILSQIGNVLILVAGATSARLLRRHDATRDGLDQGR